MGTFYWSIEVDPSPNSIKSSSVVSSHIGIPTGGPGSNPWGGIFLHFLTLSRGSIYGRLRSTLTSVGVEFFQNPH